MKAFLKYASIEAAFILIYILIQIICMFIFVHIGVPHSTSIDSAICFSLGSFLGFMAAFIFMFYALKEKGFRFVVINSIIAVILLELTYGENSSLVSGTATIYLFLFCVIYDGKLRILRRKISKNKGFTDSEQIVPSTNFSKEQKISIEDKPIHSSLNYKTLTIICGILLIVSIGTNTYQAYKLSKSTEQFEEVKNSYEKRISTLEDAIEKKSNKIDVLNNQITDLKSRLSDDKWEKYSQEIINSSSSNSSATWQDIANLYDGP